MTNRKFYRLLHARGLDGTFLAEMVGSNRSHVSEVLNNKPGHGGQTRRKLFLWLMPDEIEALGWKEQYEAWLREPLRDGADMRPEETSGDTGDVAARVAGEGNRMRRPATMRST
jgi:hypothetical protein